MNQQCNMSDLICYPNQVKTLKKQSENMRSILMNKDEEIMRLKNDMPIKPKDGGSDRCDDSCPCFFELL